MLNKSFVDRKPGRKPFFLLLLPVFFVLHGFIGNYDSVGAGEALFLMLTYTGIALVIAALSWIFYRDLKKAAFIAFIAMAYQFFFGGVQDLITAYWPESFLLRYRFAIPASLLLFLIVILWLRKRKKPLNGLVAYLNMVLMVLIIIDIGWFATKLTRFKDQKVFYPAAEGLILCDTCSKPDIYFIITDQYTGK